LTAAHEGGSDGTPDAEERAAHNLGSGSFNELGKFVEGRVGGPIAEFGQTFEADQEGSLGTRIE
jgi:hypothetical protein